MMTDVKDIASLSLVEDIKESSTMTWALCCHNSSFDAVLTVMVCSLQAGKLLDLQYVDPYAADVYDTQQQKWDAKQQREADKKALIAARAASITA